MTSPNQPEYPGRPADSDRPDDASPGREDVPPPADSPYAPPPPPVGAPGSAQRLPDDGPAGTTLVEWPGRAQSALVDWFGPGVVLGGLSQAFWPDLYWVMALAVLLWALYNGWLAGETGQSWGRRWAGTRLVRKADGKLVGGPAGALRHLAHIVDIVAIVGFLFPLWDRNRQTLADKIMGTVVVRA